jgi:hypothetical protein
LKTKNQILKYIRQQINNLYCCMVDNDLDMRLPKNIKEEIANGYKIRMEKLESICKQLENLLI